MKKVVIISSTPRFNGNSEVLCNAFMKGAEESGNQVKMFKLREMKLRQCIGCARCYENSTCVFEDIKDIREALLESDVIVLATPVYFHAMSGWLKRVIDRTVGFYEELTNKEFYYIMTATSTEEDDDLNFPRCIENLRAWTLDCLEGSVEKGIIRGAGLSKIGDAKGSKFEKEAYEMGKNV